MSTYLLEGELSPVVKGDPPTTFTAVLEGEAMHLEPGHTLVVHTPDDVELPQDVWLATVRELKRIYPNNPVLVVQGKRWGAHGLRDLSKVADAIHHALELDRLAVTKGDVTHLHSFERHDLLALERLMRSMAGRAA